MKSAGRCVKMGSTPNSFNIFFAIFVISVIFCGSNDCFAIKKSASPDFNSENMDSGSDKIVVNYDEYPVSHECQERSPIIASFSGENVTPCGVKWRLSQISAIAARAIRIYGEV